MNKEQELQNIIISLEQNLQEIQKNIEEKKAHLCKLIENKNKRWKPEKGQEYFFVIQTIGIFSEKWSNNIDDNYRYYGNNCFKTFKEAQLKHNWLDIRNRIFAIAEELGIPTKEDWEKEECRKYLIIFNYRNRNLDMSWECDYKSGNEIYCLSHNFLDECIEKIGRLNLEWFCQQDYI